jgi:hypothetical protein
MNNSSEETSALAHFMVYGGAIELLKLFPTWRCHDYKCSDE